MLKPRKQETLAQRWFTVGSPSTMFAGNHLDVVVIADFVLQMAIVMLEYTYWLYNINKTRGWEEACG